MSVKSAPHTLRNFGDVINTLDIKLNIVVVAFKERQLPAFTVGTVFMLIIFASRNLFTFVAMLHLSSHHREGLHTIEGLVRLSILLLYSPERQPPHGTCVYRKMTALAFFFTYTPVYGLNPNSSNPYSQSHIIQELTFTITLIGGGGI